jgi:glutaredoxin 3
MTKKITVFTRTTCAPCQALKRYLNNKGFDYSEVNVDANPDAMDTVIKLSGYQMVPCTVVTRSDNTQTVITGYNLGSLSNALV